MDSTKKKSLSGAEWRERADSLRAELSAADKRCAADEFERVLREISRLASDQVAIVCMHNFPEAAAVASVKAGIARRADVRRLDLDENLLIKMMDYAEAVFRTIRFEI